MSSNTEKDRTKTYFTKILMWVPIME